MPGYKNGWLAHWWALKNICRHFTQKHPAIGLRQAITSRTIERAPHHFGANPAFGIRKVLMRRPDLNSPVKAVNLTAPDPQALAFCTVPAEEVGVEIFQTYF